MTMALCFFCGNVKFGAICPCDQCHVNSTGDTNLDIIFSDHYMGCSTLEQFGAVVKLINSNVEDSEIRFWTFLTFVSERHSEVMKATPPPAIAEQVKSLYERLDFPQVELLPGLKTQQTEEPPPEEEGRQKKRWWQFWKQDT